jgi:hypothetical protein
MIINLHSPKEIEESKRLNYHADERPFEENQENAANET